VESGNTKRAVVVALDDTIVVVNKPPGMRSQPDAGGAESVLTYTAAQSAGPIYPIHRLDRPASGVVVFARTRHAAADLSSQITSGEMKRYYWAIVGKPPETDSGVLVHHLRHDRRANKSYCSREGKRAELAYRVAARSDRYVLMEIRLISGRTHQIRAQLAAIGSPIRGDLKYGARRSQREGGIALHAVTIVLRHPKTRSLNAFVAPPPDTPLWKAITAGIDYPGYTEEGS
jgi:23S rRNA pseudouridine1911/1915/1917 synthase